MSKLICKGCQQEIVGIPHKIKGTVYCEECYQNIIKSIEEKESGVNEIVQYICELCSLIEPPSHLINELNNLANSGKTLFGIRFTLYYVFEILCKIPNIDFIIYNIKLYYQEAGNYAQHQQFIQETNAKILAEQTPQEEIKIIISSPENFKRKPKYNIEDL